MQNLFHKFRSSTHSTFLPFRSSTFLLKVMCFFILSIYLFAHFFISLPITASFPLSHPQSFLNFTLSSPHPSFLWWYFIQESQLEDTFRITQSANQHMHTFNFLFIKHIKIYLKFLKNTPTCFGHSTIIRESLVPC